MSGIELSELTPVEYYSEEGIWLKRDDLFSIYGVHGGKARSAYQVILGLVEEGYDTIVTAGSRQSPQCEIVSYICENMGLNCKVFMPFGGNTSVINHIEGNKRTEVIRVRPGYNNVIIARARDYASERGFGYVPFGMECAENVEITSGQVQNIPKEVKRIVVAVGSGMSFSSVITGMLRYGIEKPVLGVRVGKDPSRIISEYASGLEFMDYSIVDAGVDYHTALVEYVGGYRLDPIYEAKCRRFLREGDLLWVVGRRIME